MSAQPKPKAAATSAIKPPGPTLKEVTSKGSGAQVSVPVESLPTLFLAELFQIIRAMEYGALLSILPTILSVLAAICEAVTMGLLMPFLQTVIHGKTDFGKELKLFNAIPFPLPDFSQLPYWSLYAYLASVIFGSLFFKNVFEYAGGVSMAYSTSKVITGLRKRLFGKYLHYGKTYYDSINVGHLHSVLMQFTAEVGRVLPVFYTLILNGLMLVMYTTVLFVISWNLTLIVIATFPLIFLSLNWIKKELKKHSMARAQHFRKVTAQSNNILSCMPLIKAYASEDKELDKFGQMSDELSGFAFRMDKKDRLIAPIQEVISFILILFLVFLVSTLLKQEVLGGVSGLLVFILVVQRAARSLAAIGGAHASFAKAVGYLAEIFYLMEDGDKAQVPEGEKEFTGVKKEIITHKLNFSYQKGPPILKDVSITIKQGEMTAIIGSSGSGKSTFINLIQRFYDCPPGTIFIDGTDIREFSTRSLMSKIAVVSQDTLLLNDTFRNNLIYGLRREPSIDEVWEVLTQTKLDQLAHKLPQQLDTPVGERGVRLSGGERQRLSIARALLKKADLLFFDEATSALDSTTEKLIQEAIENAIQNRTTIVIAHRLSTIQHANRILVFEKGEVVEQGQLKELLGNKGDFYKHWKAQEFF